jgi:hypothetical protein
MLDLLKENLSCLDQRPQHYQTRRSFLRRASVHEVGATTHLLTTVLFNLKRIESEKDCTILQIPQTRCFLDVDLLGADRSIHPSTIRCESLCHSVLR